MDTPDLAYTALVALTKKFPRQLYSRIHVCKHDGQKYEIFHYTRVKDASNWLLPYAQNCRGTMYRHNEDGPPTLVCWPMPKFFNLNENEFTTIDTANGVLIMYDKLDGSIVSTFVDAHGKLRLKSNASLSWEHLDAAEKLLYAKTSAEERYEMISSGKTFNYEYISPENANVVKYGDTRELILLNITSFGGPIEMNQDIIHARYTTKEDIDAAIAAVKADVSNIEGYVCEFYAHDNPGPPLLFKLKTNKYVYDHFNGHPTPNMLFRNTFNAYCRDSIDDLTAVLVVPSTARNMKIFEGIIANMMADVIYTFNSILAKMKITKTPVNARIIAVNGLKEKNWAKITYLLIDAWMAGVRFSENSFKDYTDKDLTNLRTTLFPRTPLLERMVESEPA